MALEWMISEYSPKVVFLVRHPAAVAKSYQRLGWVGTSIDSHFPDGSLKGLFKGRAVPADFWGYSGFFQGAALRIAFDALRGCPDAKVVRYEELCLSPVETFRDLVGFAGLHWSNELNKKILDKSLPSKSLGGGSKNPYGTSRTSAEMANSWRDGISQSQLNAVRDGFLSWGVPVYPREEWV